jgi:hypothetical protein
MAFLKRILPAILLVVLGPLTAEYLLGSVPLSRISMFYILVPIYGFGALLIREIARQTGRGWPTIVALGFVYGVIEEAFALQSLFNPDFANMHLLEYGYIPVLGMASVYTITVLTLHTVWSICAPIALVELMFIERRTEPWLGKIGLGVAALGYAGGVVLLLVRHLWKFSASPLQYGVATLILLVGLAITLHVSRSRKPAPPLPGTAPNPWTLGVLVFLGTSLLWVFQYFADKIFHLPAAVTSPLQLAVVIAGLVYIFPSARREGWSNVHRFALLAALIATYCWLGVYNVWTGGSREAGEAPWVIAAQFGLGAVYIALLAYVWRKVRTAEAA